MANYMKKKMDHEMGITISGSVFRVSVLGFVSFRVWPQSLDHLWQCFYGKACP